MRTNKFQKSNGGFKRAFRAGIAIIITLSILISWATVSAINGCNGKRKPAKPEKPETTEEAGIEILTDTIIVQRPPNEVLVRDTIYLRPIPPPKPKPKTEEAVLPKRDTLPK